MTAPAPQESRDSSESARYAALARVWATIRFSHPWLGYRSDINLDSLAIRAIGAVRTAQSRADYARAIENMVSALNDPATRIIAPRRVSDRLAPSSPPLQLLADGTVVITLRDHAEPFGEGPESTLTRQLATARGVVFDVRAGAPAFEPDAAKVRDFLERQLLQLVTRAARVPAERGVIRSGFPDDVLAGAGDEPSAEAHFVVGETRIARPRPGAREVPIVFVITANSVLPRVASGLVREGLAAIVSEGDAGDAPFVTYRDVDAGEGVLVRVRLTELIDHDGRGMAAPAAAYQPARTAGSADRALSRAIALTRDSWPRPQGVGHQLPAAVVPRHAFVPMDSLPAVEARIFSLVKVWGVATTFQRAPPGRSWETVFTDLVPQLREAASVTQYHLALASVISRLEDSHARLANSPQLAAWRGPATLPFRTAFVEGGLVVTSVGHDSLLSGASLRPGDVIRTIDGEDALTHGYRIADSFSASTPARRNFDAATLAWYGALGSTATIVVEDATGTTRTMVLPRHPMGRERADFLSRQPPAVRFVAPGVGYLAPGRVHADSVGAAFEQLRDARAIILDWREGSGTTWAFVTRLLLQDSIALTNTRPSVGWREAAVTTTAWDTRLRHPTQHFAGEAVLLIGPRAQSSMEVNALYLKRSNGTPFIGAPTSGTLAGTDRLYVPGGVQLVISDGYGPDRRGLQPDVPVAPTIAGIRAGRDEVLDAAIAYLARARSP